MSDNASTKSIATEPAPMSGDVMPVETYADRLMDDLFTEFDQSLKSGSSLPTEPPPSDYVFLKSLSIPAISLPSIVKLPQPATDEASQTVETKAVRTDEKSSDSNQWLDKWLIGAACGSLVIMAALWLGTRTQSQQQTQTAALPNPTTSVAPTPMSDSDTQFIKYMLRSLERIEKQPASTDAAKAGNGATPTQNVINLPPIPVSLNLADANSLAQSLNRLAGALEKAGVQTATAPTSTAKPQTNKPTAKPSTVASSPSPKATPTAKATPSQAAVGATSRSVAIAIPGAPTPPAVATPKPPASSPQPTAETSSETPATQTPQSSSETPAQTASPTTEATLPQLTPQPTGDVHTLVGILELGDRSAALFEINGVARRVNEGESIGGSGWSLVEVANQEAIIRRNGEVRSIYVGQKF